MTNTVFGVAADYQAARQGVVWQSEAQHGRMLLRGRDRAALLHRLSTNQIEGLATGRGLRTVLTTPIGRIIDLLTVHALDDALLLLTSPGQGPAVFSHLKRNIFFQDQVTIEPLGRSHGQLALYGPQASTLLGQLGVAQAADLALHGVVQASVAGGNLIITRRRGIGGMGLTILPESARIADWEAALNAQGALPLSEAAAQVLRVEAGHPAFGQELSEAYIPLETELDDAVSFTKGCYVGQEIIARMESRGRIAKLLRGLQLTGEGPLPQLPGQLLVAGAQAGDLTSVAESPQLGPIGLGYVRTAHTAPGTTIAIANSAWQATVVALPFIRD